MSMYNWIFGNTSDLVPIADLFGILDIPRFRDLWTEDNGDPDATTIVIYTRTGGGNREEYHSQNARLAAHPGYVGDEDDGFDSTYAIFKFVVTKDMMNLDLLTDAGRADLDAVWRSIKESEVPTVDTTARWKEAIERMRREIVE